MGYTELSAVPFELACDVHVSAPCPQIWAECCSFEQLCRHSALTHKGAPPPPPPNIQSLYTVTPHSHSTLSLCTVPLCRRSTITLYRQSIPSLNTVTLFRRSILKRDGLK